nr:hypothetical protein CFP56_74491 [Quercus suber]
MVGGYLVAPTCTSNCGRMAEDSGIGLDRSYFMCCNNPSRGSNLAVHPQLSPVSDVLYRVPDQGHNGARWLCTSCGSERRSYRGQMAWPRSNEKMMVVVVISFIERVLVRFNGRNLAQSVELSFLPLSHAADPHACPDLS